MTSSERKKMLKEAHIVITWPWDLVFVDLETAEHERETAWENVDGLRQRAEKAEARVKELEEEWNKWVLLNRGWIAERSVLLARAADRDALCLRVQVAESNRSGLAKGLAVERESHARVIESWKAEELGWGKERAVLLVRLAKMGEAWKRYGNHDDDCDVCHPVHSDKCSCGFDEKCAALAEGNAKGEAGK